MRSCFSGELIRKFESKYLKCQPLFCTYHPFEHLLIYGGMDSNVHLIIMEPTNR